MFKLKIKLDTKLQPGSYFYFPGAEDPMDWYKVISMNREADSFTFTWLYQDTTQVADPLRSRLSSYTDDLMRGGMFICPVEEHFRVPELLKSYPYVQNKD